MVSPCAPILAFPCDRVSPGAHVRLAAGKEAAEAGIAGIAERGQDDLGRKLVEKSTYSRLEMIEAC